MVEIIWIVIYWPKPTKFRTEKFLRVPGAVWSQALPNISIDRANIFCKLHRYDDYDSKFFGNTKVNNDF